MYKIQIQFSLTQRSCGLRESRKGTVKDGESIKLAGVRFERLEHHAKAVLAWRLKDSLYCRSIWKKRSVGTLKNRHLLKKKKGKKPKGLYKRGLWCVIIYIIINI